jgi:O-antigen/teichoic acid export membrane protein
MRFLLTGSFFRNSLLIMLASVLAPGLGLVFWTIAARSYSTTDVGVASTFISTAGLIASFASLGLNESMIRFFPTHDKSRVFGTALKLSSLSSIFMGLVFVLGSHFWMPELITSGIYSIFFLATACMTIVANMIQTAFYGARVPKFSLVQNLAQGARIVLLYPLVGLGSLGIIASLVIANLLALPLSGSLLARLRIRVGRIDWAFLKESLWFSAGSYSANVLSAIPLMGIPLLVFSLLGPNDAAIYFMALSIASITFIVPTAIGMSLFVEGSHGENLRNTIWRSLGITFPILIPLVVVFYLLGGWILGILGYEYASQGLGLFRLMVISSLFLAVFQIQNAVLKIKRNIKGAVLLGAANCLTLFGFSYFFATIYGIEGIGYAWILSYASCTLIGLALLRIST